MKTLLYTGLFLGLLAASSACGQCQTANTSLCTSLSPYMLHLTGPCLLRCTLLGTFHVIHQFGVPASVRSVHYG